MLRGVRTLWLILVGVLLWQPVAQARWFADTVPQAVVQMVELPSEARDTMSLIKRGGPFPYPRDGVVFSNREHRLPQHPRGYYHEYTVKTPGAHGRGARRIVCGMEAECYYSDDHYQSFRRIQE